MQISSLGVHRADRKDCGDMPVRKWVICKVKLSSSLLSTMILLKYQGKGIGVGHSVMFLFGGKQVGIFYLTVQSLFFPDGYASKDGYGLWVRFCNCHWLSSWLPKSRMAHTLIWEVQGGELGKCFFSWPISITGQGGVCLPNQSVIWGFVLQRSMWGWFPWVPKPEAIVLGNM